MRTPVIAAIDAGGTKTLVTVAGFPLERWSRGPTIRFATPRDPEIFVERVALAIERLVGSRQGVLLGVGCATPGPLDTSRGVVVFSPNQGWRDAPLRDLLAERLRVPVALEDDSNAGAIGEGRFGFGAPVASLVFVALGTGIGAGILVDGELIRGNAQAAGEIGHLVVVPDGRMCQCGRRGCVEAYAGGRSIAERFAEASGDSGKDAAAVFRYARLGDVDALEIIESAKAALTQGMAALLTVVDPGVIVIGGSLGLHQRRFAAAAARTAIDLAWLPTSRTLDLQFGSLGSQAALAGAAWSAANVA